MDRADLAKKSQRAETTTFVSAGRCDQFFAHNCLKEAHDFTSTHMCTSR